MTEQAVTDKTDDAASQASEAPGEQDMDALLDSYDEKAAPNEPAADVDTKQLLNELVEDKRQRQLDEINADYESSANTVAEKLDLPYDEATKQRVARGLLLEAVEGDRRKMKAFTNRKADPMTWDAILGDVVDTISSGKIDKEATKSRNAMRQSMTRGSTETASDDNSIDLAKELRKMSDSEFRDFKENHRG